MRRVYLDFVSLTPVSKEVQAVIKKYTTEDYMNPGALYVSGVASKKALLGAKTAVAEVLHAHADEIVFTGSGTEANNIAMQGVLGNFSDMSGKHIIVSAIEHSSIIETAKAFEKKGVKVSYIPVDQDGVVNLDELKKAITKETVLVSVMAVNNEIGTIEPISEIAKIVRNARKNNNSVYPLFHTDACQAPCYTPLYVEKLGVDLLTLDGHKIYGPRGIGMLYMKRGAKLTPIIFGGGQEKGLRSGTENIPAIMGFAKALEVSEKMREKETKRVALLKQHFISGLLKINPTIKIHGDVKATAPHIINVSIPNIDNEFFVLQLDVRGISCSTKSACLHDEDQSYVLNALGTHDSTTSLRFSLGRSTTKKDIDYTLKMIDEILNKSL